jgi:hypothetical protein
VTHSKKAIQMSVLTPLMFAMNAKGKAALQRRISNHILGLITSHAQNAVAIRA